MFWNGGSNSGSSGSMQLVGLHAKAMPSSAAVRSDAAANMLYSVEWQALGSFAEPAAPAAQPARPAATWTLQGGRSIAVRQRRAISDAAFAAHNLALLQTVSGVGG